MLASRSSETAFRERSIVGIVCACKVTPFELCIVGADGLEIRHFRSRVLTDWSSIEIRNMDFCAILSRQVGKDPISRASFSASANISSSDLGFLSSLSMAWNLPLSVARA